eukprot:545441_1
MVQIWCSCSMSVRTFAFQTIITAPNKDNSMMKIPRHACGMAVIEHDTWHEIEHKHNENKPLQQRLKHKSSNKKSSHIQFTNKYGRHVMVTMHRRIDQEESEPKCVISVLFYCPFPALPGLVRVYVFAYHLMLRVFVSR